MAAQVATGTGTPRPSHRLTAARVFLLLVYLLTVMLLVPAYVRAADTFTSEVRFPSDGEQQLYVMPIDGSNPLDGCEQFLGGGINWVSSGGEGPSGGAIYKSGNSGTAEQVICGGGGLSLDPGQNVRLVVRGYDEGGAGGTAAVGLGFRGPGNVDLGACLINYHDHEHNATAYSTMERNCTAPADTVKTTFRYTGHRTWTSVFNVFGALPGGDCLGVPGPGTDDQLVWGSPALSSPTGATQWGHHWWSGEEACLFTDAEVYHFAPAQGFGEGDTWLFGLQSWAFAEGRDARVTISWVRPGAGGGSTVTAAEWRSSSAAPITALDAYIFRVDSPPDVTHLSISVSRWVVLGGLMIANVEGDPVLDGGEYPWSDIEGWERPDAEDYWGDCAQPDDGFDVWGWVKWLGCIVDGGFRWIGALIGGIARDMAEVLANVIAPFFSMIGGAIADGLAGAMGVVGDVLETLFVPTGDAWTGFTDRASGKVPIAYGVEAVTALGSIGASGPAIGWNINLLGVAVAVPIGTAAAVAADYRWIGAAAVWFLTALTVWARVRGSVGAGDGD